MNGVSYDATTLQDLASHLIKSTASHDNALGEFITNWLMPSKIITLQTSGSTGTPKTIEMSKQAMINSALSTAMHFDLQPKNSALCCLPFDYIAAKMMLVRALVIGLHLDYVEPSSNPLHKLTKTYDFCAMIPLQLSNSITKLAQLKTLIVGGAKVPKALIEQLPDGVSVFETYGMTETVSHIAVKDLSKRESVFHTLPHVKVMQDSRQCLKIMAPHLYIDSLTSNDRVKLYSPTSFEWLGRWDNIINSGSVKIQPELVESQLETHINLRFFISGIPHEQLGECVALIIEGEEELHLDFKILDPFLRPKKVHYVNAFVETPSGKVNRRATLDLLNLNNT